MSTLQLRQSILSIDTMTLSTDQSISDNSSDYVVVSTTDDGGRHSFPQQQWPMSCGHFKALLMLSPGINHIAVTVPGNSAVKSEVRSSSLISDRLRLILLIAGFFAH